MTRSWTSEMAYRWAGIWVAALGACGDTDPIPHDTSTLPDIPPEDIHVPISDSTPDDSLHTTDIDTADIAAADIPEANADTSNPPDTTVADDGHTSGDSAPNHPTDAFSDTVTFGTPPTPIAYHTPIRTPAHPRGVTLGVTFDMPIDQRTLTIDTDTTCTGALQVSTDAFATCLPLVGPPTPHSTEPNRFELKTVALPASGAPLALRIDGTVTAADGTPMGWVWNAPPIPAPYHHTIVIDGIDDFNSDESLMSTTPGHTVRLAWDADWLYFALRSPDLSTGRADTWWVIHLGDGHSPGSTQSVTYNTQSAALPFQAAWHLRWRISGDYGGALVWREDGWTPAAWGPIPGSGDVAAEGDYVEMRIPLATIGNPTAVRFVSSLLREQAFNEATWAVCPAGSAVDGHDPDFTRHVEASLFYRNIQVVE